MGKIVEFSKYKDDLRVDVEDEEDDEYDEYDDDIDVIEEKIRKQNKEYIATFDSWLEEKGLKDKTISNHLLNVDAFLLDYLPYYENSTMQEGIHLIGGYLGDWFVRKCMWSTPKTVKSTAASIKKFYQCMMEEELISKEMFQEVKETIKDQLPLWMEYCDQYNNIDYFEDEDGEWW